MWVGSIGPFTGSVYDKTTGLQYMNARFYQPATGRFLSQDSYTGNPYDPWTQHLYTYCGNNPTNMVDPTGHFFNLIAGAIGAAVGAGISFVTYGFEKGWDNLAWDDGEMWKSIGVGAATGGLAGLTFGASLIVQTAGNAAISAAGNAIEQGATKGFDNIDYTEVGISAGVGAATGFISYGVTKAVTKSVTKSIAKGTSNTAKGIDSITGQIAKDKPVVVMGESMGRVNPVAKQLKQAGFNVKTYNPQNFRSSPGNLNRLDVEANRSWIRYWTKDKGATVIDIGIDPSRTARSPFYGVENRSVYQNWNYPNVIKYNP